MEDIKKNISFNLLEVKTMLCVMKNTLGRITGWRDIVEGKMTNLEDTAIETTENKTHRKHF